MQIRAQQSQQREVFHISRFVGREQELLPRQAGGALAEQTPLPQTYFAPPASTYQMQHPDWTMRKPLQSFQTPAVKASPALNKVCHSLCAHTVQYHAFEAITYSLILPLLQIMTRISANFKWSSFLALSCSVTSHNQEVSPSSNPLTPASLDRQQPILAWQRRKRQEQHLIRQTSH